MADFQLELRAIDLERFGINLCFVTTDSAARKDAMLKNAQRLADAFIGTRTALDSFIDDVEAAEKLSAEQFLPKLPDVGYLGDDVSYGYDSTDMRDYALEAVRAAIAAMKGDQP